MTFTRQWNIRISRSEAKNIFNIELYDDNVPIPSDVSLCKIWIEVTQKQGTEIAINFPLLHLQRATKHGLHCKSSLFGAEQSLLSRRLGSISNYG